MTIATILLVIALVLAIVTLLGIPSRVNLLAVAVTLIVVELLLGAFA